MKVPDCLRIEKVVYRMIYQILIVIHIIACLRLKITFAVDLFLETFAPVLTEGFTSLCGTNLSKAALCPLPA